VCKAVREFESAGRVEVFYTNSVNHQWATRVP
jgi:hypothetical protein